MRPVQSPTETLTLLPTDREAVFVIATDPEAPEMAALIAPKRLNGQAGATVAAMLGLPEDKAQDLELVNPEDLSGIGLSRYLTEGVGLSERSIAPDRDSLDALAAPVVLLRGRLAEGQNQALPLPRGMNLVGRYETDRSEIGLAGLSSVSVSGIGAPAAVPPMAPSPRTRAWLAAFVLGLGVILALIALALWLL